MKITQHFIKDMTIEERLVGVIIKIPILIFYIFYLDFNYYLLMLIGIPTILVIDISVYKVSRKIKQQRF